MSSSSSLAPVRIKISKRKLESAAKALEAANKQKKQKKQKKQLVEDVCEAIVTPAVVALERAGLPSHMTLFSMTSEVLLVCLGFLSWSDLVILVLAFEHEAKGLESIKKMLIQRMNREFSAGLTTLAKKTKSKVTPYNDDDLSWLFSQIPADDEYPTLNQSEANKLYSVPISKLKTIPCTFAHNARSSQYPLKLYAVFDVIRLCLERHGNSAMFLDYQSKLKSTPKARLTALTDALAMAGLPLPDNHEECKDFISGRTAMSRLNNVVQKVKNDAKEGRLIIPNAPQFSDSEEDSSFSD